MGYVNPRILSAIAFVVFFAACMRASQSPKYNAFLEAQKKFAIGAKEILRTQNNKLKSKYSEAANENNLDRKALNTYP